MAVTMLKKNAGVKPAKKLPGFLPELICCFLVSRACLGGQPLPLGIALAAAAAKPKRSRWLCLGASMAGYLSASLTPRYPVALVLLALALWVDDELCLRSSILSGLTVASATLISDLYFLIVRGATPIDLLTLLLCTSGSFLAEGYFEDALPLLKNRARRYLRHQDTLALLLLVCAAVRGLPELSTPLWDYKDTLCMAVTLCFARSESPGAAVTAGALSAFLIGAGEASLFPRMGLFALAGLLGGVFRFLGKGGVCGGALLAGLLSSLSVGQLSRLSILPLDFPLACLVFLLTPNRWLQWLGLYRLHPDQSENEARIRDSLCQQLKHISAAFIQLSSSVFALAGQPKIEADPTVLLTKIEERVCGECKAHPLCWKREAAGEMERLICHCFAVIEQNGTVSQGDLPLYFQKRCDRMSRYLYEINNLYELYKNELFWQGRLDRATAFTIRQLEDISAVMDRLADQLNQNISFHEELSFAVSCALDRKGFSPKEVEVTKNAGGRYEVHLEVESCQMSGGCKEITAQISQILERPMEKTEGDCRLGRCKLGFAEATPYRVMHAVTSTPQEGQEQCGDTAAALTLPDGNQLFLLSDGKGSGQTAHLQSSETVRLLCRLLYAGFTPASAVRLANSVLGQMPDEEGFATIDLALLDLSSPQADFIKSGACATYIKRKNLVKRLESQSLPAGILEEADMELKTESLQPGDLIIMLSDGVADAFPEETVLMQEIARLSRQNSPRQLASSLVASAKQQKGNRAWDDMTVIAAKVIEA